MTRTIPTALALFCFFSLQISAQTINYNDVAVIVNDNSPVSQSIGTYFQQQRNIPAQNMIHVNAPLEETIDSVQFENLRNQIEAALLTNNLADNINYLVTTKGLPFRVSKNGACDSSLHANPQLISACTCVESELPLILSANANEVLQNGVYQHSYGHTNTFFDRDTFDMFLVSRLDGYTEQDVRDMIDRSGPDRGFNKDLSQSVLDLSNVSSGAISVFEGHQISTENVLLPMGCNVIRDTVNSTALSGVSDVILYFGVHYQPSVISPSQTWDEGAMAHLMYENSAMTFYDTVNTNGNYLAADAVADGATVVAAYPGVFYVGPATQTWDLFSFYMDTTILPKYNAAEAYYMASPTISKQNLLIGDPKTSVVPDILQNLAQTNLEAFQVDIFPNPSNGTFTISGSQLKPAEVRIEIYDLQGRTVFSTVRETRGNFEIPVSISEAKGLYVMRLSSAGKSISKKMIFR